MENITVTPKTNFEKSIHILNDKIKGVTNIRGIKR